MQVYSRAVYLDLYVSTDTCFLMDHCFCGMNVYWLYNNCVCSQVCFTSKHFFFISTWFCRLRWSGLIAHCCGKMKPNWMFFPHLSSSTVRHLFYFLCSLTLVSWDLSPVYLFQILLLAHFFLFLFFFYSCTISSLLCSFTLILCLAKIKKKRVFFACCVIDSVTVLKLAHTVLLAYIFLLKVFPQSAFIFPFQPLSGI